MYLSERRRPASNPGGFLARADTGGWRVGVLVGLGLTSLFTDIASELVTSVLPAFVVVQLGYSAFALGALDAVHHLLNALIGPIGAVLADRWRRHVAVASLGYALGVLGKVVLAAIGTALTPIALAIGLDRIGKGLRTAPRDALVASCAPSGRLGTAFGVHRSFDTAGAMAGPLLGVVLLAASPDRFRPIFVIAALAAGIGLVLFALLVPGPPSAVRVSAPLAGTGGPPLRALLGDPAIRRVAVAAAALGPFVVGDVFLHLAVQQQAGLSVATVPALFAATAATFLLLAVPAGALADRVGARTVLLAGHALLVPGYALLALHGPAGPTVIAVVLGVGAHAACADGVLSALAAAAAPPAWRATTIAMVTTTVALSRVGSSLGVGAVWATGGLHRPFVLALCGLPIAVTVAAFALAGVEAGAGAGRRGRARPPDDATTIDVEETP